MATALFELDHLSKSYGAQEALREVSTSLAPGTIGLVGPNGSGKSTLLRLLLGLIEPTAGRARVLGRSVEVDPLGVREQVGYMPEHDCLIPTMTGIGLVAYMGRVSGLPREVAIGRAHDVLQFVGLREERYRKIAEYSVGMRQRVKLAQALVHDPPLLLLDEPTAGLDPTGRDGMLELLRNLAALPGHSLVISTHLLHDVEGLCDQIVALDSGHLLAAGPLGPMLAAHTGARVVRFRGDADRFAAALASRGLRPVRGASEFRLELPVGQERPIFEAALESQVQIRSLGAEASTVEELFLHLVAARGRAA